MLKVLYQILLIWIFLICVKTSYVQNTTRIPQIQLGEIHEISSISVRFLEILLVLEKFQDVSLTSVGFQKNFKISHRYRWKFQNISTILTDISGNFRISKDLTDISENFKNFKKSHRYRWKFQEISPISVEISKNFKKSHRYRWKFHFTFLKDLLGI